MNLDLVGKAVAITVSGKGMGPAISRDFAREGTNLVVIGRDLDALETLKVEIDTMTSALVAHSASKWGLRGITKSTAIEAGPHNVNVNIVAPGMVDGPRLSTKVVPGMADGRTEDEVIAEHAAEYAFRRIGTAEGVAGARLFLASDVSRQVTGIDLPVDGGWAAL